MTNATTALQVLFRALGLTGDVIMPAFTFIATAHAAAWERLQPRFVDILYDTHCINPSSVLDSINAETAALVGVHLWGHLCDINALQSISKSHRIPLLLDASQAIGWNHSCLASACGDVEGPLASVISLHATKLVSSLEGGAVLTNDDGLANDLRAMRNFGFSGYDNVVSLGTNAKLSEFAAAFALRGLECFDLLVDHAKKVWLEYKRLLADLPGITFLSPSSCDPVNFNYAVLLVNSSLCRLSRDELIEVMWAENIRARRYFYPGCHRSEPYASYASESIPSLPVTDDVAASVLVLPASSAVTLQDVSLIVQRIRLALQASCQVRQALLSCSATV
jgi:dTDP-4-amino-4,6-dideoxygalactose transaminase